mmetsp:Transcript_9633/g.39271  ORF Transcript_9633/g.39271 Transcript_9633/m.39271 type:complete len:721 (-) Transcript_9633:977-3139(-)
MMATSPEDAAPSSRRGSKTTSGGFSVHAPVVDEDGRVATPGLVQGEETDRPLTLVEKARRPFERAYAYFERLSRAFGWRYVALVALVYGINQGVGEAFLFGAQRYFFLDDLGVSAARYTQYDGFANIPWQIKAIYGMASDSFSCCGGLKRTPYMVVAGVLGVMGALVLSSTPAGPNMSAVFLIFMNYSIASPDVMVDASAAERAKTHPHLTADIQSLCWGALHIFNFFATASVGYLLKPIGPRGIFGLLAFTSLAMLVPASLGWLGERRQQREAAYARAALTEGENVPTEGNDGEVVVSALHDDTKGGVVDDDDDVGEGGAQQHHKDGTSAALKDIDLEEEEEDVTDLTIEDEEAPPAVTKATTRQASKTRGGLFEDPKTGVFVAAFLTCGTSVIIGSMQVFYEGPNPNMVEGGTTLVLGSCLAVALWILLKPMSPALAGTACYIFIEGAFQPQTAVIFDWSHDDGDKNGNCARHCDDDEDDDLACGWARDRAYPCIDPVFYQWMRSMLGVFGFLGVIMYNTYFSDWPFRKVLLLGQFVYFASNMMDWVWVSRTNLELGLNDRLFLFGSDAIQPLLKKLHLMPVYVLAARLCPENVEATLFALLMGLSNFGSILGLYHGVALLAMFGGVDKPEYRHLPAFVFVRTIIYLAPMALVLIFVPHGSPNDSFDPDTGELIPASASKKAGDEPSKAASFTSSKSLDEEKDPSGRGDIELPTLPPQ